jgi:tetrapyrrole methylase family protein/MazG family protein
MGLTIVGLGPGHVDDVSRRAWKALEAAPIIYLRTAQHPCVPELPRAASIIAFDDVYDRYADFDKIYATITEQVLNAARAGDVVYAVPGDPLVAESTVTRLIEAAQRENIPLTIINGISFIEPSLALLGIDALDGLQLLDAIDVADAHHPPINPDYPALLAQVYNRQVASNLKLTLMNQYPDDFTVRLIHAAGTPEATVETVPLYEIDRSPHIKHMTCLFVPALGGMSSFERFQETIAHLRAPEGCPWDREQTHLSLRPFLLEETYEVLEALDNEDPRALVGELGDLLLQIVLHTQIAIEDGEFRMTDILREVNEKMIRRHPHVWGDVNVDSPDQVVTNWDAIKQAERAGEPARKSILDSLPKALPALVQAYRYQEKAAKVNFDWPLVDDVVAKVREEFDEVINAENDAHRAEEMGDLLFVIANWARWHKIDPETALREANAKFYRRFSYIEEAVAAQGKPMTDYTLAELDALWDEAKAKGL